MKTGLCLRRFGRLLVLRSVSGGQRGFTWECRCDCGRIAEIKGNRLLTGHKTSCGACPKLGTRTVHGDSKTVEHATWCRMLNRCYNERSPDYPEWGGRGITVAAEWRQSYEAFLEHVGRRPGPGYSIDRIDNSRGYEPGNVR